MSNTSAIVKLWGLDIGAVLWDENSELAAFEYTPEFIATGIEVAPLKMPAAPGIKRFPGLNRDTFSGLPGLLADSLPDKFGNALINSWLARQGRRPDSMNPVERLCYVGRRGMGALEFFPAFEFADNEEHALDVKELVSLSNEVLNERAGLEAQLDTHVSADAMRRVLQVGTSAGGARAKAIIAWNETSGEVRSGQLDLPPGFAHWILKLDGITHNRDKESLDDPQGYGIREYVYYLMAKDAGLEMSECRLFRENGRSHFMTRRFDRSASGEKIMMQSLCALGHYDFNIPGACSYDELFIVMRDLGLGAKAIKQQFRRMVFNVLGCNRDDHTKNVAFLMDKQGQWSLSPAFDVTFSYNPLGKFTNGHQMTVNGKREEISRHDLLEVGLRAGLKKPFIVDAIEQVEHAVQQWQPLAEQHQVPTPLITETTQALTTVHHHL